MWAMSEPRPQESFESGTPRVRRAPVDLEGFAVYGAQRREDAGVAPDESTDVKRTLREADPETVAESERVIDELFG